MSKTTSTYRKHITANQPQNIPQSAPLPNQIPNNAGGFVFELDRWKQLDRFLIIGTTGGTFYVGEAKLTKDNAKLIEALVAENGTRVVQRIVDVSVGGKAASNDPALFALAIALSYGDAQTKNAVRVALSQVARIGTHMLHFVSFVDGIRSWGRSIRQTVGSWYTDTPLSKLAQNVTKYANRDGWTHLDVMRLAHPKPTTPDHGLLFKYVAGKPINFNQFDDSEIGKYLEAVEQVKTADAKTLIKLITDFKLPREVLPTESLKNPDVWAALLPHMGMTAMIRNLATMTRLGLIAPLSVAQKYVINQLSDKDVLKKARIHPIAVLTALLTYQSGHGLRGSHVWTPVTSITDALDNAFYLAFDNVIPTNKRIFLGIDVSGSMTMANINGNEMLTAAYAAAALALVTQKTEKLGNVVVGMFTTTFKIADISSKSKLDTVYSYLYKQQFGGTDCAQPILHASKKNMEVDSFVIYTDSETWAGHTHPSEALKKYRKKTGIPASMVVVGMTATQCSIADPNDARMLDVCGLSTDTPALISDFIRGE